MGYLNGSRGVTFNKLVKMIKGISRRKDSTIWNQENAKIVSRITDLVPSIAFLMKEHPQHIPVILYHLSSLTSKLKNDQVQKCVNQISGKNDYFSCKTCKGLCNEVYENFIPEIRGNLPKIDPKGISHLLIVYSSCKNPKISTFFPELLLRMSYFIYSSIELMPNFEFSDEIDHLLSRFSGLIKFKALTDLSEYDYLKMFVDVINSSDNELASRELLVKQSKYYIPVNLMDVCTALESINSGSFQDTFYNLNEFGKSLKYFVLELSFRFLLYSKFTNLIRDCSGIRLKNNTEMDTICRLIGQFKNLGYRNEQIVPVLSELLTNNLEYLEFRDLGTLLDSLSYYSKVYNLDPKTVDFSKIASRVNDIVCSDKLFPIRSLSTVINAISKINEHGGIDLEDYESFFKISSYGLKTQILKWPENLKSPESLSSIAIAIKDLKDYETLNLVSEVLLKGLIPVSKTGLYDFNVILEVLIKELKNVNFYEKIHDHESDFKQEGFSEIDTENTEKFRGSGQLNATKVFSSVCLILTKCSFHFCTILSERPSLLRTDLRELCYFCRILSKFYKLDFIENEFLSDCLSTISKFTTHLESFFTRNHRDLSDLDHDNISQFLSESHSFNSLR
ncbi:hypothetical protein TpMuguga_02g00721 [Theileria parva strain Muguga]|uniref:Uncharacterized protein n=1 Tax=Theileria parva TaxID=5875 RepID=Q4N4B8_THEPA|nr:uncharacterized protein TpMuguga_02g00721 [Theileria parva strain Muguga]EAN33005.1 hypothetical protein TpMuguga_02g00721 [Theileria parva strain Muguga]|eukprot:XP_765288.1 hypothetical protein [Theileria parva strain Muguga]